MKVVIAGDSRAKEFTRDVAPIPQNTGRRILHRTSGRLRDICDLVLCLQKEIQGKANLIVMVGLLWEFLEWTVHSTPEGNPYRVLQLRGSKLPDKKEIPSRIKLFETHVLERWPSVRIVWILGYPIDLRRYFEWNTVRDMKEDDQGWVKKEWGPALDSQSTSLAYLLQDLHDEIRGFDVIHWIDDWRKDEAAWAEFVKFLQSAKLAKREGSIPVKMTKDGLHPTKDLIKAVWTRMIKAITGPTGKIEDPFEMKGEPRIPLIDQEPPVIIEVSPPEEESETGPSRPMLRKNSSVDISPPHGEWEE